MRYMGYPDLFPSLGYTENFDLRLILEVIGEGKGPFEGTFPMALSLEEKPAKGSSDPLVSEGL